MMSKPAGHGADLRTLFYILFILFFGLAWLVIRFALGKGGLAKDLYTFKYTYK